MAYELLKLYMKWHNHALLAVYYKTLWLEVTPKRTRNSKLCLSVKTHDIRLARISQSLQTEISCVLLFSHLCPGQDKQEPIWWHFAVDWDSLQEESCPVSAQIWGDSTSPSLIQKARLSGPVGIVSDFRGPHSFAQTWYPLVCLHAFINFIQYEHIWMSKHWNGTSWELLPTPC